VRGIFFLLFRAFGFAHIEHLKKRDAGAEQASAASHRRCKASLLHGAALSALR
jgi:hypothetical protein